MSSFPTVIGPASRERRLAYSVPVTTVHQRTWGCVLSQEYTRWALSEQYKSILWIFGHHDATSVEGQALLAAYKLWRSGVE